MGTVIKRIKTSKHLTLDELHDYFHELLTPSRDAAVAAHLAACPACAKKAHRLRLVLALLGGAAKPTASSAVPPSGRQAMNRPGKPSARKIRSSKTARPPGRSSGHP